MRVPRDVFDDRTQIGEDPARGRGSELRVVVLKAGYIGRGGTRKLNAPASHARMASALAELSAKPPSLPRKSTCPRRDRPSPP